MNAQYCAKTGRDYCCVVLNRTEKRKDNKKNVDSSHNMCGMRNGGLFRTIFEDLKRETKGDFLKIILECLRCVELLCETVECSTQEIKDINLRKSVPPRDGSAVAHR
jgi:hypothetical protein